MRFYLLLWVLLTGYHSIAQDTTAAISRTDTVLKYPMYNRYGDLLNDDPKYNPRYPWYIVSARVLSANVFNWAVAKYVYKFDWPSAGINDWKNNFKLGPEWDNDKFGINFIGHPHSGNIYFNVARSNGYNFWQSFLFAVQGSMTWEYVGENTRPSYNDMINTPISGAFLGEILYRISSNILDDRTRGRERVLREIFAAIVNPPRALSRLSQGKMFRVSSKEVSLAKEIIPSILMLFARKS